MAGRFKGIELFHVFLILGSLFFVSAQARPLNELKLPCMEGSTTEFYLGGIKNSGSSSGEGHRFSKEYALGGIKASVPSPGEGHAHVSSVHQ